MFVIATQTSWQISELDQLPLSELMKYYKLSVNWIKSKYGVEQ